MKSILKLQAMSLGVCGCWHLQSNGDGVCMSVNVRLYVCVCVSACACIPAHAISARRTETQKTYIFKISFIKDIYA